MDVNQNIVNAVGVKRRRLDVNTTGDAQEDTQQDAQQDTQSLVRMSLLNQRHIRLMVLSMLSFGQREHYQLVNKTWKKDVDQLNSRQKTLVMCPFPRREVSDYFVVDAVVANIFNTKQQDVLGWVYYNIYNPRTGIRNYDLFRDILLSVCNIYHLEIQYLDCKILNMLDELVVKDMPNLKGLAVHQFCKDDNGNEITQNHFKSLKNLKKRITILALGAWFEKKWIEFLLQEVFIDIKTIVLMSSPQKWPGKPKDHRVDFQALFSCQKLEEVYLGNRKIDIPTLDQGNKTLPECRVFEMHRVNTRPNPFIKPNEVKKRQASVTRAQNQLHYLLDKLRSMPLERLNLALMHDRNLRVDYEFNRKTWTEYLPRLKSLTLIVETDVAINKPCIKRLLYGCHNLQVLRLSGIHSGRKTSVIEFEAFKQLPYLTPNLTSLCFSPLRDSFLNLNSVQNQNLFIDVLDRLPLKNLHCPSPVDDKCSKIFIRKMEDLRSLKHLRLLDDVYVLSNEDIRKEPDQEDILVVKKEQTSHRIDIEHYMSEPLFFCRCVYSVSA